MSIRHINPDNPDAPVLGTAQAAVQSCVSLIAGMSAQPEAIVAYWLDLYYQVRRVYELQQEPEKDERYIRPDDLYTVLQQLWQNALQDLLHRETEARTGARKAIKNMAEEPAPEKEEQGVERSAPPREPPDELPGFDPVAVKLGGSPGNHHAADAAAFKRATLERLERLRAKGVLITQIAKAASGNITDHQIIDILEAKKMPIAVYRVLAAALDQIEG